MAVLVPIQVKQLYLAGDADRIALYAVRNVTAGDTVDLSGDFSAVKRATGMGATAAGAASLSVSGTVVTIPAGMSGDAAWLTVYGCAT